MRLGRELCRRECVLFLGEELRTRKRRAGCANAPGVPARRRRFSAKPHCLCGPSASRVSRSDAGPASDHGTERRHGLDLMFFVTLPGHRGCAPRQSPDEDGVSFDLRQSPFHKRQCRACCSVGRNFSDVEVAHRLQWIFLPGGWVKMQSSDESLGVRSMESGVGADLNALTAGLLQRLGTSCDYLMIFQRRSTACRVASFATLNSIPYLGVGVQSPYRL